MKLSTVLCFCCVFLRLLLAIEHSVADPPGFVSLDCGYDGSAYADNSTGLTWTSDSRFYDPTGNNSDSSILTVAPQSSNSPNYFRSVRYFTGNRTKYCYVFDKANAGVALGLAYLVRASFWPGQYASSVPPPGAKRINASRIFFQIYINADPWDDVLIDVGSPQASSPVVKEMYVVANYSSEIAVCLGGPGIPGLDSPFISALELRLLESHTAVVGTMAATSRHLFKLYLIDFGSDSTSPIRYPKDRYDRIWEANTEEPKLSTTAPVYLNLSPHPPSEVLQTARATAPGEIGFNVSLSIKGNSLIKGVGSRNYYYDLYMAEISPNVTATGQRVFDFFVFDSYNSYFIYPGYDIMNLTNNRSFTETGLYSGREKFRKADAYEQGSLIFSFVMSKGSAFGPLLNGLELLVASDTVASAGTIARDVNALEATKASFQGGAPRSWQGDACLPYPYEWISCSSSRGFTTIISLSLAYKDLRGEIPPSIANLTSLSTLDLQGNKLNGSIPEFLARLPNLKLLLLQNNNFSGVIPTTLLERQSIGELQINVDGNPFLLIELTPPELTPIKTSKNKMKSIVIGISTGIIGVILVSIFVFASCMWRRRRSNHEVVHVQNQPIIPAPNNPKSFSYSEVETITNNFSSLIGKGGFSKVFHGVIDNKIQVAIKIVSTHSTHGTRAFLNEVDLLSRVHHRNLVQLLGYCIERQVMLFYEYVPNGSLEEIIHGVSPHNYQLSWRERLQILLDVAQGVNYLHNGCRPKIIHRDLKPANILIDDNMRAKISDFGISQSNFESEGEPLNCITTVQGTTAYMAPEYINHGETDEKTDVYAFGIVLLEVISGRSPIYAMENKKMQHIKDWVTTHWRAGNWNGIIDPKMSSEYNSNKSSMWKVLGIGMACIHDRNTSRPPMVEVTQELLSALHMELDELTTTNTYSGSSVAWNMDNASY